VAGREQIFDPDDMVIVRHDGKFNKAPTMKLHQSIKESFELGREPSLNQFPAKWPEFKQFWGEFYVTCNTLYLEVLSALALGFGLPEKFFESICNNGDNTLKAIHYPPVPIDLKGVRMMAHTDLEIVTLLLQDNTGGLELKNTAGEWVKATPVPGVIFSISSLTNSVLLSMLEIY
jgi:isopenicillin N synthase-like dioxygenase